MILEKRRGRWWVYLDPKSEIETELVFGIRHKDQRSTNRILIWLRENVSGGCCVSNQIYHRVGDYRDFVVITFADYNEALMFFLTFEQQAPEVEVEKPFWKHWSPARQAAPTAMTFEPWESGARYFKGGINEEGDEVAFFWSMSRNAAGNYLAWEEHAGYMDRGSVRAFDKRKDAKEWAWTKANNFGK